MTIQSQVAACSHSTSSGIRGSGSDAPVGEGSDAAWPPSRPASADVSWTQKVDGSAVHRVERHPGDRAGVGDGLAAAVVAP